MGSLEQLSLLKPKQMRGAGIDPRIPEKQRCQLDEQDLSAAPASRAGTLEWKILPGRALRQTALSRKLRGALSVVVREVLNRAFRKNRDVS